MSEADAVGRSNEPATTESLTAHLRDLGVEPGMVVLVHSSLSALGWVCGGAVAVVDALWMALQPGGTLVMPAHSGDLSEPSRWRNPPVPEAWWDVIRQSMPAFDPLRTPTRAMGAIAETFRRSPGVLRSHHPTSSFAALGRHAADIIAAHALDDEFGESSPLARLYDLDARVLLLGVGHDSNTSLHLAERRAFGDRQPRARGGAPMLIDGQRQWVVYSQTAWMSDDFERLGAAFERSGKHIQRSNVGLASACLMAHRSLVDFGVSWLRDNRVYKSYA